MGKKYIRLTKSPVKYKAYEAWVLVKRVDGRVFRWLSSSGKDTGFANRAAKYKSLGECPERRGYKRKLMHLVNGSWFWGRLDDRF